jgi:hypothetical protein
VARSRAWSTCWPGLRSSSADGYAPTYGSDVPGVGHFPQTIGGNLICRGNVPAAHFNPDDRGAPNTVRGKAPGECAGLTR